MEIVVHSTLPSVGGSVIVASDPNHTVYSLVTAFCIQKGIPHRKEYMIRNRDQLELSDESTLTACALENGETVFLCTRELSSKWPSGHKQWLLLALITFIIGATGISAMTVIRINESAQPVDYGVVLDAGSSHTKLFVYQWDADKENGTGIVEQIYSCKAKGPGISNFTDNPQAAGKSIIPCLDEAVKQVPNSAMSHTPVFLGATAGMRLVRDSGNNKTSEAILNSIRSVLDTYPFHFNNSAKQVRIISGEEEGSFSWVTTNYLAETFGELMVHLYNMVVYSISSKPTYGALDMGGASTQITFIPSASSELTPEYSKELLLYGNPYKVYTHSYLCYGFNEAYTQYLAHLVKSQFPQTNISSPCAPSGNTTTLHYAEIFEAPCTNTSAPNVTEKNITYSFVGESDATKCADFVVSHLFNFSAECEHKPCSFNGVYQPQLYGNFFAFSGFYIVTNFLNVTSGSLAEFENATVEICMKNYTELLMYAEDPMYLIKYCFDASYIHALLVEGYKFNSDTWKTIQFKDKIKNSDLGWSLGFMLNSTNRFPVKLQHYSFSLATFVILILLFIFFAVIGICFCCYASRVRKTDKIFRYKQMTYGSLVP